MILFALTTLAAMLASANTPAAAAGAPATVAPGINAVIAAAAPGTTIRLVPGNYPFITIRSRRFDPPITIDATGSTLAGVELIETSGVRWTGGTFKPAQAAQYGSGTAFVAHLAQQVSVENIHASDFRNGIGFDRISGGSISGNWLARMSADGIDLGMSRNIAVRANTCSDFAPSDGAHPDCIQAWSRPSGPPVSDLTITGNTAVGSMQGISLFNHVRDGVDDGGFDRVAISGNTVQITYADGISVNDCRGCSVRNNTVTSLPNYIHRAQLYVAGGSVTQCGNVVPMVPRQGTPPCID